MFSYRIICGEVKDNFLDVLQVADYQGNLEVKKMGFLDVIQASKVDELRQNVEYEDVRGVVGNGCIKRLREG